MASRKSVTTALVTALALFLAVPASAQVPERERGYITGTGGLTATTVNSSGFGASIGFNITPDLLITGDVGRLVDVVPTFTRDDLKLLDNMINADVNLTGLTHLTKFKMPANYVTAGLRYKLPTSAPLRPYLSATGGIARLAPEPKFVMAGVDYTSELLAELATHPVAKAEYDNMFADRTRPLASVGGGVMLTVARHFTLDVGYKYTRVFIKTDYLQAPPAGNYLELPTSPHSHDGVGVHRVILGVGYAF